MRLPAQGSTGGWVVLGLVFQWFPLCEFSLFGNHSSILAWKIPWMEEPGGLQLWGRKESNMTERHSLTHSLRVISLVV